MYINLNKLKVTTYPDGMKEYIPDIRITGNAVDIFGSVRSFDELLGLAQVVHWCRTQSLKINLTLHYLIGGRMDRNVHGVNVLRTVTDVINGLDLENISVVWPHSSSTIDLLNAFHRKNTEVAFLFAGIQNSCIYFDINETQDSFGLVLPDAGAEKRYYNDHHAGLVQFKNKEIVIGGKHRDVETGNLSGFSCPAVVPKTCVIVDDLCDAGGTFSGLATKLREAGAENIALVVYHGLFFKGIPQGIDFVYTTDSARNLNDLRTKNFVVQRVIGA